MKPTTLLPHKFKRAGLLVFIPSFLLGIAWRFFDFNISFLTIPGRDGIGIFEAINLTDELAFVGIICGLLLIAFSKEKHEDEFISSVRLASLQWAVLINYILLVIAAILIHGMNFIDVMMYNMLTVLILFIVRFHILLAKSKGVPELN